MDKQTYKKGIIVGVYDRTKCCCHERDQLTWNRKDFFCLVDWNHLNHSAQQQDNIRPQLLSYQTTTSWSHSSPRDTTKKRQSDPVPLQSVHSTPGAAKVPLFHSSMLTRKLKLSVGIREVHNELEH